VFSTNTNAPPSVGGYFFKVWSKSDKSSATGTTGKRKNRTNKINKKERSDFPVWISITNKMEYKNVEKIQI
jgi:hypothetical protein